MQEERYPMNTQAVRPILPPDELRLEYAGPMPPALDRADSPAHRCAKAAWVAPLIAIFLSYMSIAIRGAGADGRVVSLMVGLAYVLLIVGGLVCGIVALCNVKGRRGILTPAIVGVVLNVAIVTVVGMATFALGTRPVARPAVPPPPPSPAGQPSTSKP